MLALSRPIVLELLSKHWSASLWSHFGRDWLFWAEPEQRHPPGDWRTWVLLGGRGAGKTRAGAEWASARARYGHSGRIALIGPTFHDVREVNIDVIGVDWYPPLTDWRDGAAHLDAELAPSIYDRGYLFGRVEAGEFYDWFYASDADRMFQTRTPITDGAHAEPWIFRAKDLRNFWSRAHYDRPGGLRAEISTAWIPESKPIWLIELGCPAVDKGANAPNLFSDAKSAESALPPFSSGARDHLIQRRALEAYLSYWDVEGEHNPASSITGKPMIEEMMLWCWDARPYPSFPGRQDIWADAPAWRLGHWLNGRPGLAALGAVVEALCARAGVEDVDVVNLRGVVSGYVVDSPATARDALAPLLAAHDAAAGEQGGDIVFFHRDESEPLALTLDDLSAANVGEAFARRGDGADQPVEARVRFSDPARDYLIGGVSARRLDRAEGGVLSVDAPLVLETEEAERMAQALLADRRAAAESMSLSLGPAHGMLEPGDRVTFGADIFEIVRIEDTETRQLEVRRARSARAPRARAAEPSAPPIPAIAPTPALAILDLPPLPGLDEDERPLAAVFAAPWLGPHDVYAGASATRRAQASQPAIVGELLWALWPGPVDRWDDGNVIRIRLYGGALESVTGEALLNGANAFAVESDNGEWEVVQTRSCVLVGPGEYELSGFLRGVLGSAHAMRAPHPVGARIVKLDQRLARLAVNAHEWGEALSLSAPPAGGAPDDARAANIASTLPHAGQRPWAPAHLRAKLAAGGDVEMRWMRCARIGGDSWGAGEPPLAASSESYLVEVLDGAALVRSAIVTAPAWTYGAAEQAADFAAPPASFRIRVAQIDGGGRPGLKTELTITL